MTVDFLLVTDDIVFSVDFVPSVSILSLSLLSHSGECVGVYVHACNKVCLNVDPCYYFFIQIGLSPKFWCCEPNA